MDEDDDDDELALVIDAGSSKWSVGFAGDNTPLAVWGLKVPLLRTAGAIRERRETMWSHLRSWVRAFSVPVRDACFSVSVFDDADGDAVSEIAERCFGGDEPLFDALWIYPQEHLAIYGNGRAVGLVVNLGFTHVTTCAIDEGYVLGQMARKVRWQPEARWQSKLHAEDGTTRDEPEQLHADAEAAHADAPDASRFIESTKLAEVIADALCDAPTDCFKDFLNNIILVGGFAGGTHGVSWGGRPPQGVPSPPEWEFEDDEAGSPLPRHLPGSWLKDALQSAVDEALKARGHQVPQNHWGRGAKVVCPSTAPQEAWVGGSIVASLTTARQEPRRLTRDMWLQAKAEGRRLVGWTDGAVCTYDRGTVVDTSPPSLWAKALLPADPAALLATQEEAARLVACAASIVQRLPRELISLIEADVADDIRDRDGLRGRPPLDESQPLVRASWVARAAAQQARADIEGGASSPPQLIGFPSGALDEELHHRIVVVPTSDGDARETFALRLGATIADLVAAIARRATSKGRSAVPVSTLRLMYSGFELTALPPSTRLDRVGRDGDEGVPLRDGAEVWRYDDVGKGGPRLAAAVMARGLGVADAAAEETWGMRTLLQASGMAGPPAADENERAEPVDDSKDAVADCEPLCRLRMHRCIEVCQDACFPMRKQQMVDYSTFTALGMDDPSNTRSPAVEAAMEERARRGRAVLEHDKKMGAWAQDDEAAPLSLAADMSMLTTVSK